MRVKFTKTTADKAQPQSKPYQIHDSTIVGLVLRVQPTGRKFWKLINKRKVITLGEYPSMTLGGLLTKRHCFLPNFTAMASNHLKSRRYSV